MGVHWGFLPLQGFHCCAVTDTIPAQNKGMTEADHAVFETPEEVSKCSHSCGHPPNPALTLDVVQHPPLVQRT